MQPASLDTPVCDSPLNMSFSSTDLLQFDELREVLASYSGSEAGREIVRSLEPHSQLEVLQERFSGSRGSDPLSA